MSTVKIDVLRDERLFEAELFTKLPLRLAFIGLALISDGKGKFVWRPNQLKIDILPYDCVDMSLVLEELCKYHLIEKFDDGDDVFGIIVGWNKKSSVKQIKRKTIEEYNPSIPDHDVLQYLIDKTGTDFKFVYSTLQPIVSILTDKGITVDLCKKVIDLKCRDWLHCEKMSNFLRTSTLFNRTKFYSYLPLIDKPKLKVKTEKQKMMEMFK